MKKKTLILALAALAAVIGILLGVYLATRPETNEGMKTVTVTVVHKDGSEKDFVCTTEAEYLGEILRSENIAQGDEGEFGLMIHTADGEKADWNVDQGWWQIYEGDTPAITGADEVVLTNGGVYRLVYTVG